MACICISLRCPFSLTLFRLLLFILQSDFFTKNEELLKLFGAMHGLEESEKFLLEYPHLASDFTASWLTVQALNLAMEFEVKNTSFDVLYLCRTSP